MPERKSQIAEKFGIITSVFTLFYFIYFEIHTGFHCTRFIYKPMRHAMLCVIMISTIF